MRLVAPRRRSGITLTEILISILIMGVGLISLATLFPIGLDRILRGWLAAGWPDEDLERHGLALFEGLYLSLQVSPSPGAGVLGGPGEGAGG